MAQPLEMRRSYRVVNEEAAQEAEREAIEAARHEPERRERHTEIARDRPVWVPRARGAADASKAKQAISTLAAEVVVIAAGMDPGIVREAVERGLTRARASR